jgi:tetratricopeptide (TPR) repeat protein
MAREASSHPDDWFRSPGWDEANQQLFEEKLSQARTIRPQYMRIKALSLLGTGDKRRVAAGRDLLHRLMEEHPDDIFGVSGAHYALGDSFAKEGRHREAIGYLRECLKLEREGGPKHRTELRLAEVLIAAPESPDFDEVWELLGATGADGGLVFNSDVWRIEVGRARLLVRQGDEEAAGEHARRALDVLARNEPQLPRHPTVGRIHADRKTVREMKRLSKK